MLVRSELELARQELAEKAKSAGVGAGMLSGSALTGVITLGSLTALLVLAISLVAAPWLAALIVTIMWAAVTAILALAGKRKIQNAGPFLPEQTIENVKEDFQWARSGAQIRQEIVPLAKETFAGFQRHKAQWLAAAISYFTMFAIAPLIIVIVEIAGVVLGHHRAVLDALYGYMSQTAGKSAAGGIRSIVTATFNQKRSGPLAQIISWTVFAVAAIGLFASLQEALNTVWEVKPKKRGLMDMVRERALSFAGVICIAFLLLVALGREYRSLPLPDKPWRTFSRFSDAHEDRRLSLIVRARHGPFWIVIQVSARVPGSVV